MDKPNIKYATTSEVGRALLQFKGVPLSLKGYAPFKEVYDTNAPMATIRCSRQVG